MTSIKDLGEKIKGYSQSKLRQPPTLPDDLFLGLVIILVAFGSFGLGRLSKIEGSKTPIQFEGVPIEASMTIPLKTNLPTSSNQSANIISDDGE